ncbi:GL15181 [Drosophila persimilis]|uniref:GL15181 n=1 Tax=Drosophila persimilis TaxID=7234 RepID=B4H3M2_DROPE|nr:GL15181 [Drosophila persimilis]
MSMLSKNVGAVYCVPRTQREISTMQAHDLYTLSAIKSYYSVKRSSQSSYFDYMHIRDKDYDYDYDMLKMRLNLRPFGHFKLQFSCELI